MRNIYRISFTFLVFTVLIFQFNFALPTGETERTNTAQILNIYRSFDLPKEVEIQIDDLKNRALLSLWQGKPENVLKLCRQIKEIRVKAIWKNKTEEILTYLNDENVKTDFDGFLTLIKGWAELAMSEYQTSAETFKMAAYLIKEPSLRTDAVLGQSLAFLGLRKYKESFSILKGIYVQNSYVTSLAAYIMGEAYFRMKEIPQAMTYFQQSLIHDWKNYSAQLKVAEIYEKIKNKTSAWQSYAALAMLDPEDEYIKGKTDMLSEYIKGDPINYLYYARLKNPLQKEPRYTPSPIVRVGLYSGQDGMPDNLTSFGFMTSGSFKVLSAKGMVLLSGNPSREYKVRYNENLYAVEISDKWGKAVPVMQNFSIETEQGTSVLIKDVRGTAIFGRDYGDKEMRGRVSVNLTVGGMKLVNLVPLEDYLPAVLSVTKISEPQALKALAVILRTKVFQAAETSENKFFDICDDKSCIEYRGLNMEVSAAVKAVDETQSETLTVSDNNVELSSFTACGGHTVDGISDTLQTSYGYITPVEIYKHIVSFPSSALFCSPQKVRNFADIKWSMLVPADIVLRKIKISLGIEEFISFTPLKRSIYGHILSAEFKGKDKTVVIDNFETINKILAGGALRSSLFYVIPLNNSQKLKYFLIRGMATGKGKGFCIRGAEGLARQGKNYEEILKHYFPKLKLEKPNKIEEEISELEIKEPMENKETEIRSTE